MHVVVLAGGNGTRLWPRSRAGLPKHLLNLQKPESTMLQETVSRILPVAPAESVYVVTNQRHAAEVRHQLPEVPSEQVLEEPFGRNSGPAIGYAALHVARTDPETVMVVLSADHVILKERTFHDAIRAGIHVAEEGYLVTLGITPDAPETAYGYIEAGATLERVQGLEVCRVERFAEKPDLATATQYLESGRFVWNAGMFLWKASTILSEIERYMPNLHQALSRIAPYVGTAEEREAVAEVWPSIESKSIDYGVLEHSDRLVTIPVDIGWSDVGDWNSLSRMLPQDEQGNSLVGSSITLDCHGSLIYSSERLIAAIGLDDMIVVDAGDALLICPKDRAQDVRQIVERLHSGEHSARA